MNIYVSNLSFSVQDEELKNLFSTFGTVSSAKVINDRETGRSRGFGFVEMDDNAAAQEAIDQLNQSTVDGRSIKVSESASKPGRSFGNSPFKNNAPFSSRKW